MALERAREVLRIESEAIEGLIEGLDERFEEAVNLILNCKGRVIVTGMGKSGYVAQKIAATLSSTGTPALFMHPAEGLHGDLGVVTSQDVVIALSYSGETDEIIDLLVPLKRFGVKIIAMTGDEESSLAKNSDLIINVKVRREACPFGLAPTASTTAALAMGDALAMALLEARGFKEEDFAMLHPGGGLGKKLFLKILKVEDIMRTGAGNPTIEQSKLVKEALFVMTSSRLGATCVVDESGILVGFFTDGDLRRNIEKDPKVLERPIREVMTKNPLTITKDKPAMEAWRLLQERQYDNLPVIDAEGRPIGMVDVQDLLKAGMR